MIILVDGQTLETEERNRGIGVYFKNVLSNMIANTTGNIWYLTMSRTEALEGLDSWTAARVVPVVDSAFAPSFDYGRSGAYGDKLNEVIAAYGVDCYWNPNPLMVNVLLPDKKIDCPFFATIHDLIPHVMPIADWSEEIRAEYRRRLDYLAEAELLCVSEATESDVRKCMGEKVRTFVTPEAADASLFYRIREENQNQGKAPLIVYTGGFDYRKNLYAGVEAFAAAKKQLPELRLVIVCQYSAEERCKFEEKLSQLEIKDGVELTGYIPHETLATLYQQADVFFFPSLYEGFGLPLLEAMLGGAYILSADNSSLPEVCGEHALFCNAEDVNDMAEKLVQAVQSSLSESLEAKRARQQYALGFTWKKTAGATFKAFEEVCSIESPARKRIALVTPWPMQHTGIANYVYRLIPHLSRYFDCDIFVDNTLDKESQLLPNEYGNLYPIGELNQRHGEYDELIYHIGNSTQYHTEIYSMLKKYGGIAEIHDFVVQAFFYWSYYAKEQKEVYRDALIDGYGDRGEKFFEYVEESGIAPGGEEFPMGHSVAAIAKKTIVHNEWSYHQLQVTVQKAFVPHACFDEEKPSDEVMEQNCRALGEEIGLTSGEILIGCFGWVNGNKRPDILIQSFARLCGMNYKVRLVFFGEDNTGETMGQARALGVEEYVKVTGYLEEAEYQAALELCDIVVNLRYPSMGEASGTLSQALKAGKPVIVSAVNQYLEYPDDICWKLPVGSAEVDTLTGFVRCLLEREDVRQALGRNAATYANEVMNCENIAKLYARIIN